MKLVYLLVTLFAAIGIIGANSRNGPSIQHFLDWSKIYGKEYQNAEFKQKFEIFAQNYNLVNELNQIYKDQTEFELNQFADMTIEEFKSKILMKGRPGPKHSNEKYIKTDNVKDLPDSYDWRDHGAVTPVKDQGSVGTCWAFSTVQNVEGQYFLRGNPLMNISVEQVVDCDGSKDPLSENSDCGVYGGWPYLAFQYIERAGGMIAETNYSYCAGTGACQPCEAPGYNKTSCGPPIPYCLLKDSCQAKFDKSKLISNLKVIDWKAVSKNETDIAQQLVQIGPLSVALNAEMLQFYHKGIFNPFTCNPANLDHAVLLVGFGSENSRIHGHQAFWIVKNSWGPKWGENGYFRILRNKGTCGINTQVATAVLQ